MTFKLTKMFQIDTLNILPYSKTNFFQTEYFDDIHTTFDIIICIFILYLFFNRLKSRIKL